MVTNIIIVLTIIGIILFFLIREIEKYSNLKSSYEIRTYLDEHTIKVEVNYDFNYEKLYPLIITIRKARKQLKMEKGLN